MAKTSVFRQPPLPAVAELRNNLTRHSQRSHRWIDALKLAQPFPSTLRVFKKRCRDAGQTRLTPLLLRYGPGDCNWCTATCMANWPFRSVAVL